MKCSVDNKLPRTLDYDENECQCSECHQKRKYARGKRIHGHDPPVDIKRSFFWYQIKCEEEGKSVIKFIAKCPYKDRFAKATTRPDVAMRSPPYVIRPQKKECDQGQECLNPDCGMSRNVPADEADKMSEIYEAVKDSL